MIVMRCDAGKTAGSKEDVGTGHLVRTRVLARALAARECPSLIVGPKGFSRPDDTGPLRTWIDAEDWTTPEADAKRLVDLAAGKAHVLYLDDYRCADADYQKTLNTNGLRWMQQFDGSVDQPYWCDLLVNASPSNDLLRFRSFLQKPEAKDLLGPQYAILRPEFPPKDVRPAGRPIERVLVCFGGAREDDRAILSATVRALLALTPNSISFVWMSAKRDEAINALEREFPDRFVPAIDPPSVADLFVTCDLALTSGGTITSEAAACGLPMLLVALADNQENQCQGWQDEGAAIYLGTLAEAEPKEIAACIAALAADDDGRAKMSKVGRQRVTGEGADLLAKKLIGLMP